MNICHGWNCSLLSSTVSISRFVFGVLLMVFQITGEKRPSSEMMKPKPKPQKKKKKKDPNEPTKPVSAYALFFRDTQAAIKGQNPNATFGDVSKIVASMWDGLGEEQKQVDQYCVHSEYGECTVHWSLSSEVGMSAYTFIWDCTCSNQLNDLHSYSYSERAGFTQEVGGAYRQTWVWLIRICLF